MNKLIGRLLARFTHTATIRGILTPGDLYRRMSLEFRDHRAPGHGGCLMPMVVFRHTSGNRANWGVEALTSYCPECERLARRIARGYAAHFDLRDLTDRTPLAEPATMRPTPVLEEAHDAGLAAPQ